jgi:uncharacterized protein
MKYSILFLGLILQASVAKMTYAQTDSIIVASDSAIQVDVSFGRLHGSIMRPHRETSSTACLIIAGSGPTDRNGNGPSLNTDAYLKLATFLAQSGFASLRYDKRGIGESAEAMIKEDSVTFEVAVEDARSMIHWLKETAGYDRVVVIGHSEGSLVGMLAAPGLANAFISVAGPGRPADVILKEQLNALIPPEGQAEVNRVIDDLKAGKHPEQVPFWLMSIARPSVQNYIISWFKYDPAIEIKKLNMPICILQGGRDLQVTKEDAWLLTGAANNDTFSFIDAMNHVLVDVADMDVENKKSYGQPEYALSPAFLSAISDFLHSLK